MPIYEYTCRDCRTRFELRRTFGEADTPAECVECHGNHTARALSRFFALSRSGDGGSSQALAGSGCAGCHASTCAGCGH